ncbi:MAG: HTH-type transcriptional regulator NimR [Candidatus Celerinatantimonas neptuna]|nr:MAG: HTH-type transcriptional regulator NimR [Candidatus Celerinatantimonas neptuna]
MNYKDDNFTPVALKRMIDANTQESAHQHAQGQLIWMSQGMLQGQTEHQQWLIQKDMLVWIPPFMMHQAQNRYRSTLGVVYLPTPIAQSWPGELRLVEASRFAIGIIDKLIRNDELSSEQRTLLIGFLRGELKQAKRSENLIPLPSDPRLTKITDCLIQQPHLRDSLAQWGQKVGASERTLARLFIKETGLNYRNWYHRLRRNETLKGLQDGLSNEQMAEKLGFSSGDSFSHWVQRAFQCSPRELRLSLKG